MDSSGQARIDHFQVDRLPIGDLPLRWTTQGETILVSVQELERYGGRISAETRVPVHGDRPIEGTITMVHVDTAPLSAEVPEAIAPEPLVDGEPSEVAPESTGQSAG